MNTLYRQHQNLAKVLGFSLMVVILINSICISNNNTFYPAYARETALKVHTVNITTPISGQSFPVGRQGLKIIGTSTDNAFTDCHVSVIVNDVRPYQKATATGPNGDEDYSIWEFNLNPDYTQIKKGENRITTKISCQVDNNNSSSDVYFDLKWYSVSVNGV
ncbi:hypothetical protein BH18THE2_BH18THE2_39710 [soil metagenome]